MDAGDDVRHIKLSPSEGDEISKNFHIVEVPLVPQCYSWDCGLACVSMILKGCSESCDDVYTKDLDAMECGESIWTIDLAYILHRHNIQLKFCTITLGVKAEHSKKPFYQNHFNNDEARVNLLFQNAAQRAICVEKRHLDLDEVLNHVKQGCAVVVLVNQSYLYCLDCGSSQAKKCWDCLTCCQRPYWGHFIVLCGFDRQRELVFYKDPDSCSHETCRIHFADFDRARFSDGTDEDLIVVQMNRPVLETSGDAAR